MGGGRKRVSKRPTVPNKTVVWWDIDSCPVPDGYDPRCVRQSIESALKKTSGFAFGLQEVTIFAIGNLIRVPPLHNEAISSYGILMRHAHFGLQDFFAELLSWKCYNSPPATIVFITENPSAEPRFSHSLSLGLLEGEGEYTVLTSYSSSEWRWKTLLKETPVLNQMLEDKCTLPRWLCTLCVFGSDTYRDFAEHLYGFDHANRLSIATHLPLEEFDMYHQFLKDRDQVRVSLMEVLRDLEQVSLMDDPLPVAGPSEFHEKDARKQSEQRFKAKKKEKLDRGNPDLFLPSSCRETKKNKGYVALLVASIVGVLVL